MEYYDMYMYVLIPLLAAMWPLRGADCPTSALRKSYSRGCPQGNIEASIKNNIVSR